MEITIDIFVNKMKKERLNIIDIRNNDLYKLSHIPNSYNINPKFLLVYPHKNLDKKKIYYIYCQYGEKSYKCSKQLNELGYQVYNLKGGYNAYQRY